MTEAASQGHDLRDAFAHCAAMVREEDRSRYAARLFLPGPAREAALALDAFRLETLKISFLVSEPGPGEIRLQWWREVIEGAREAEAAAHPAAMALCAVITRHNLPVPAFGRYLEGVAFELYHDPVPDRAALEGLIGETESFLMQMTALASGKASGLEQNSTLADVCGHGGMALGIARLLRLLPWHQSLQQVRLPLDLLAEHGLDEAGFLAEPGEARGKAIEGFAGLGLVHAEKARAAIRQLPKAGRAVFLPLTEAELVLRAVLKVPEQATTQSVSISPLKAQWALWRTAWCGF